MKKKYLLIFVIILSLTLSLISGCSSDENNPENNPEGDELKDWNQVVRMTVAGSPYSDPGFGTDFVSLIMYINVYDTLVYPDHNDEMQPMLAKNWDTSDDGKKWTFYLRDDVNFHDGKNLTADDVVFSANRMLKTGQGYAYLYAGVIESVEKVDEYVVSFNLEKPYAPFLSILSRMFILNEELMMENIQDGNYGEYGDYGTAWLDDGNDAGSGAYIISDWQRQTKVAMSKFNDYFMGWNDDAPLGFELVEGTETATVRSKFASGDLEISDQWQSNENIKALSEMEGIKIANLSAGAMLYIQINNKLAPTDDVHVRKALAHLVDYEEVYNTIFPGTGKNKTVVPKGMPGYTEEDVKIYEFDIEAAKEELKKSKYYDDLESYPINLTWIAEVPDEEKLALQLQAAASQVGLIIEINKAPHMTNVENVSNIETTPNMNISFNVADFAEAGSLLAIRFHSNNVGLYSQTEWLMDDYVDDTLDEAFRTMDYESRMEKYGDVIRYVADKAVCIPVGDMAKRHAYNADKIYWPAAERTANDETISSTEGYAFVFREFRCIQ